MLFVKLIIVCVFRSGLLVLLFYFVFVGESRLFVLEDWVFIEKCWVFLGECEGGGVKIEGEWEEIDGVWEMEGVGDICIKEELYEEWCIVGELVWVCCKLVRFWMVECCKRLVVFKVVWLGFFCIEKGFINRFLFVFFWLFFDWGLKVLFFGKVGKFIFEFEFDLLFIKLFFGLVDID